MASSSSATVNSPFHPSPPPSSDNGPTVIVIVFVSFGCIFFVGLCFFALFCYMKKRNKCCLFKKCKEEVEETDVIHMDEHRRVKEAIVEGPNGRETVVLSIEDDKHIEEKIYRNEKVEKEREQVVAESGEMNAAGDCHDLEAGESSSKPHHHLVHKP